MFLYPNIDESLASEISAQDETNNTATAVSNEAQQSPEEGKQTSEEQVEKTSIVANYEPKLPELVKLNEKLHIKEAKMTDLGLLTI